jgi:RsiW-degrading membrane proteinase PrsW (M82 family)
MAHLKDSLGVAMGVVVGAVVGGLAAGAPGAALLGVLGAVLGAAAAQVGPGSGGWPAILRRYWVAASAALVTGAALVRVEAENGRLSMMSLVVICGGPVSALLLARAAAGIRRGIVKTSLAFVLGGTVIAIITVMLYPPVTAVVLRIGAPPIGAALRTIDTMSAGLASLDALTAPGSVALFAFAVVVSPLVEEAAKPLGGVAANPRSRREAFVLGAAAGAGFALSENVVATFGPGVLYWFPTASVRAASAAVPVVGAGIAGLALHDRQLPGEGVSLLRALGLAAVLHATWNALVTVSSLLAGRPASVFVPAGGPDAPWGAITVLALAGVAAAAVAGVVRAGSQAEHPQPGPLLALRSLGRLRRSAVAGWAGFAVMLAVPISWGLLGAERYVLG